MTQTLDQAMKNAVDAQSAESFEAKNTFPPISDYGLIGNCHTAALVSSRGSIDWLCLPRFDSPSLFARILDLEQGGSWQICPQQDFTSTHRYLDNTNILETTFDCDTGKVLLIDFIDITSSIDNPTDSGTKQRKATPGQLIRVVRGLEGTVEMSSRCTPQPDYGRSQPQFTSKGTTVSFDQFTLSGPTEWQTSSALLEGRLTLAAGEQVAFTLTASADNNLPPLEPTAALSATTDFWRGWAQQCTYQGPYRDAVIRSSLALKLMTYEPTGAIVAAPTTSLPEKIGGDLNWDYRMSWIRDSSFTLYALLLAGYLDDEMPFFNWLMKTLRMEGSGIKILYPITDQGQSKEQTLSHLSGYRHSPPVRIGNQAAQQVQLDVYGEVLSAIHFAWKADKYDPTELWPHIHPMLDWVSAHWHRPDNGIWEIRGEKKHYVYSKVMMWVALDCGIEISEALSLAGDIDRWRNSRQQIKAEVMDRGWSDRLGAFKQAYESEVLDASNLLLPTMGFIEGNDPKMISTIDATIGELVSNGLCYRYKKHPISGQAEEGTFVLCTFWLINALIRAGRLKEADEWFEQMLVKSSPLGLFAEEMMPDTGLFLGNFPQAFSHLGVINGAVALAHVGRKGKVQEHHARAATAARRGGTV